MMKKSRGIIGTVAFHLLLLLLFFIMKFSTPLPLPPEEGILVNFGYDEEGFGQIEPESSQENVQSIASQAETSPDEEEEILTQEFEESVAVKENKQKDNKQPEKTEPKKDIKETQSQEKQKETYVIDSKSLFSNRNKQGNQGIKEGDGNQGVETGDPNANNYGPGSGTGNSGVSFSLDGRVPQSLPKPEYTHQVEGKVVVEVKVAQDGKVVYANPGVKGSTTLDQYLLKVAKEAALNARFDRKPDAPAFQKGTITYHFILQ